jgi:hypothetical protein
MWPGHRLAAPEARRILAPNTPAASFALASGSLAANALRQLSDLAQKSVEPIALAADIPPRTLQEFLVRYKWDEDVGAHERGRVALLRAGRSRHPAHPPQAAIEYVARLYQRYQESK